MALKSSKEKIYLTKESFQQYKDRLKFLQEVARPQVIEEIKEARGQGDLSENAEYDSARDKQAAIENEINEIQHILDNYEIIKSTNTNVVKIGSKVQIISLTNDNIQEVTIVGSLDADPFSGKISNTSALAKALLDKEVNSIIEVEAPKKSGALITADFALEQGRDVYVCGLLLNSLQNEGGKALYERGAFAIKSIDDILHDWKYPTENNLRNNQQNMLFTNL